MKYKAVIFDMDGVLVDSEPLHKKVGLKMMQELNIPIDGKLFLQFTGSTVISMWRTLAQEFPLKQSPEELTSIYNQRFTEELVASNNVTLMDEVLEVLTNLKERGIPVALASSSTREVIEAVLQKFGIAEFFQVIASGSDVTHSKPHPEIFLLAAKKLNISPDKCIVVEDSTNGTLAAKNAGMYCIGYKPLENHQELIAASMIIKSFSEFDLKVL
jgi:beta-phosphoglucomutase family hydrolase